MAFCRVRVGRGDQGRGKAGPGALFVHACSRGLPLRTPNGVLGNLVWDEGQARRVAEGGVGQLGCDERRTALVPRLRRPRPAPLRPSTVHHGALASTPALRAKLRRGMAFFSHLDDALPGGFWPRALDDVENAGQPEAFVAAGGNGARRGHELGLAAVPAPRGGTRLDDALPVSPAVRGSADLPRGSGRHRADRVDRGRRGRRASRRCSPTSTPPRRQRSTPPCRTARSCASRWTESPGSCRCSARGSRRRTGSSGMGCCGSVRAGNGSCPAGSSGDPPPTQPWSFPSALALTGESGATLETYPLDGSATRRRRAATNRCPAAVTRSAARAVAVAARTAIRIS